MTLVGNSAMKEENDDIVMVNIPINQPMILVDCKQD